MDRQLNELPLLRGIDSPAPVVRRELVFRPQSFGGATCYIVEDPVSAKFYRVGVDEYTFISLLKRETSIRAALLATRHARPECKFGPADAISICHWLVHTGLAHDAAQDLETAVSGTPSNRTAVRRGRLSPLSVQIPLFHPDRFFDRLTPFFGWCFSFPALLVWLVVAAWAVKDLIGRGQQLVDASTGILAAGNWIWLSAAWLVLKTIHECGHAVACKRVGGEVREAGVIMILLAPLAYVDVTSSWRFRSKWSRIQVSAAGMYVELFLAAVATIVWARTEPGVLNHTCFNIMTTASVMTLLFNANPLMRYDGYYILSDFLELPNLYSLGQQYVAYVARRYLFGMPAVAPRAAPNRALITRVYSLAALVWRNMVFFGLVLTASTLFAGAGVLLSITALALWAVAMIHRSVRFARRGAEGHKPNWFRFAIVAGGGAAAAGALLTLVPWPGAVAAPAVVRYSPQVVVRAESEGFVRKCHVHDGQEVKRGQLLVELVNHELEFELAELDLGIRQSRINRRIHQRQNEMAKAQAELEKLRTLERQYADKQTQVAKLDVHAPCSGSIVTRNLVALEGTYLAKGAEVLSIGRESAKEFRLSIAQRDIRAFRSHVGRSATAYFPHGMALRSTLKKINPRASTLPADPSLCAPEGGPLTVRHSDANQRPGNAQNYELLVPRFTGVMPLNPAQSERAFSGQRVHVALHSFESVGAHLYGVVDRWIDRRLHRNSRRSVACRAGL